MAARDWVRKHLGEKTARAIERVAAALFGDDNFVECPTCKTAVPANLVSEWGHCPRCKQSSEKLTTDALLAQRDAAMAAGEEAAKEIDEIDSALSHRRSKG